MSHSDAALYEGQERRRAPFPLTDEQIEQIAERAAEKAVKKMTEQAYQAVGKGVVSKLLYILGVLTLAGYAWAMHNGWIKP